MSQRNKKSSCCYDRSIVPYRLYLKASVWLPVAERKRFPRVTTVFLHAILTLLYRTLQSALGYDTVIRRMWVMAVGRNFAFKIAVKPLLIETWLILTVVSSTPYQTAPSPTIYDVRFSHNICVTDRRQSDDASYSRFELTVSQKLCNVEVVFCHSSGQIKKGPLLV